MKKEGSLGRVLNVVFELETLMSKEFKPLSLHYRIRKETRLILEEERLNRLRKGQQANLVDLIAEAVYKTFGR